MGVDAQFWFQPRQVVSRLLLNNNGVSPLSLSLEHFLRRYIRPYIFQSLFHSLFLCFGLVLWYGSFSSIPPPPLYSSLYDFLFMIFAPVWWAEFGRDLRLKLWNRSWLCVVIPQAVDKRQPVVPAPVSTAAAAKLITSSQAAAAAGKLGFHVGQSAASPAVSPAVQAPVVAGGAGLLPAKKPPISRGVPPPVPPNKPVVPPKKEAAAYLRRPESMQSGPQQDTVKYGKQTAVPPSHGSVTSTATSGVAPPVQAHQQPLPASTAQAAAEEEVSNKTADSR